MPILYNHASELLREPNLLRPNVKPQGPVKIDTRHPLAQAMTGYWLLNEGAFTIVRDLVDNNNGTFSAGPTWKRNEHGNYVNWNNSSGGITVPNAPELNFGANVQFSVTCMFRRTFDNGGAMRPVSKRGTAGWLLQTSQAPDNWITFRVDEGATLYDVKTASGFIQDGKHYTVTGTRDASGGTMYVNGIQEGFVADTSMGSTTDPVDMQIVTGLTSYMDVFFVALHARAITEAEAMQFYLDPYQMLIPA